MATYFIADTHFGHRNIIQYCNRPFAAPSIMDSTLVKNWNAKVQPNDFIYHLGDVALMNDPAATLKLLQSLNGKIHLIRGNHERSALECGYQFEWVRDYYELKIDKQLIVMCHYPFLRWNKQSHGAWHLHGHVHGNLKGSWPEASTGKILDVGVDVHNYSPISFEELKVIMETKQIPQFDHHGRENTI